MLGSHGAGIVVVHRDRGRYRVPGLHDVPVARRNLAEQSTAEGVGGLCAQSFAFGVDERCLSHPGARPVTYTCSTLPTASKPASAAVAPGLTRRPTRRVTLNTTALARRRPVVDRFRAWVKFSISLRPPKIVDRSGVIGLRGFGALRDLSSTVPLRLLHRGARPPGPSASAGCPFASERPGGRRTCSCGARTSANSNLPSFLPYSS